MKHVKTPLRPGMTAIAAVIALSSTPLLAQAVDAPAEPAVVMPVPAAPPVAEAAPVMPQASSSPSGAVLNIPKISVNMDDAPAEAVQTSAAPAPQPAKAKVSKPQPVAAQPVAQAAPEPAVTPPAPAPVAEPVVPPPAAIAVAPPVAKTSPAPVATEDDTLPIMGGIGLGALALAGGAFALGRRRKSADVGQDEMILTETVPVADPVPVANPVPAFAGRTQPVAQDAPATSVPAGFDTSRYGRHVQAAYRGPTPENPFLSLKNRLKRARFYDQRERMAAEQARLGAPAAATAPKAEPAMAPRRTEHVVTRQSNWSKQGFRPAYQG